MRSRVLFISPRREDAARLGRMLSGVPFEFDTAATLAEARPRLLENPYRVVLTESALPDGTWLDVLALARQGGSDCEVIVTRAVLDGRFWAEVLNLGGYDMLAQPFAESEVRRVLSNACTRIVPEVHAA